MIPLASTYTGNDITISGDLTVDQDLTWNACEVIVNAGVTITVTNSSTFTITNASLVTHKTLWEGIRVEDGSAVVVNQSSTICGAEVAVASLNDGTSVADFTLDDANLFNNTVGLAVFDYSGTAHPGTMVGTVIAGGNLPSTSALSVLGLSGATHSSIGIYFDGNDDGNSGTWTQGITIGDAALAENLLIDLDLGIRARNSTIQVGNTQFEEINAYNAGLDNSIALLAFCNGSVTSADIRIGNGTGIDNEFVNCVHGVFVKDYNNARIVQNEMTSSGDFERGIEVEGIGTAMLVQNNDIAGFSDFALRAINNDGADIVALRDNELNGNTSGNQIAIIALEVTSSLFTDYDVRDNMISNVPRGIFLLNVENPIVEGNDIGVEAATPLVSYGIRLENGLNAEVRENTIDGNCSFAGSCTDDVAGILAEASEGVLYAANKVLACQFGFYILDFSGTSNAVCNEMEDCEFGFHFDDVTTGAISGFGPVEQVGSTAGLASDNSWDPGLTANRTNCINNTDGDDIDWYYRGVGSTPAPSNEVNMVFVTPDVNTDFTLATDVDPSAVLTAINPCGLSPRLDGDTIIRTPSHVYITSTVASALDVAVTVPTDFPLSVYRYLELAQYRAVDDPRIQNLRNATNLDVLASAIDAFFHGDMDLGNSILENVIPVNEQEDAQVEVLFLLSSSSQLGNISEATSIAPWVSLVDFLTPSEQSELETIANGDYSIFGKAKFMARALLVERDYERTPSPNRISALYVDQPWLNVTPNPATAWLRLETDGRKLGEVFLYDLSGRIVLQSSNCRSIEQCNMTLPASISGWHILEGVDEAGNTIRIPVIINP